MEKNKRNSGIELFRILMTLFVLIVHFNGYFIGLDTKEMNFYGIGQIIIESITIIAVNGFILISGYYGINNILKSLWKLYQCMICITIPLMIATCIFHGEITITCITKALLPFSTSNNYFINGYIIMIIFSQIINNWANVNNLNQIKIIVILILFIEFWYDCVCNLSTFGIISGYSGLHFVFLYIIGRYLSIINDTLSRIKISTYISGYILCTIFIIGLCYFRISWGLNYSNPIIVISSCFLFVCFTRINPFVNNIINKLASCSLFVYILQISSPFETYLIKIDHYLYDNYNYALYLILSLITIIIFYSFCHIWDQTRIIFTKDLFKYIEHKVLRTTT